jgi:hypothetical protein
MVSGGSYSCINVMAGMKIIMPQTLAIGRVVHSTSTARKERCFVGHHITKPPRKLLEKMHGIAASIEIFLAYNIDSLKRGLTLEDVKFTLLLAYTLIEHLRMVVEALYSFSKR